MDTAEPVNILLVNDRQAQLTAWQAVLEDLGQVYLARSGLEALEHLLTIDFAAILLDVHMPSLDGFETAALIRQRPRTEFTPILFVTAINTAELDRQRGYALGAVDYIFTPIVPDILRAKVRAFVDLYRKTRQVAEQAAQLAELNQVLETQLREIRKLNEELTHANAVLRAETIERERAEAELLRAHAELEDRVRERTAELASANAELEHEIEERRRAEAALRRSSAAERLARQDAERAANRMAQLQAATAALANALTSAEVAEVIVRQAALAFGASAGRLAVLSPDCRVLELIQAFGHPELETDQGSQVSLDEPQPLTDAVRQCVPIWLEDRAHLAAAYPHLANAEAEPVYEGLAAIPLMLNERPLGGLVLEFVQPRAFDARDKELLVTLGQQCAQALERARLFVDAHATNAELESRVHARTAELKAANAELAHSREQLRQLAAHVQALREEERARIAREVHDDLGGALTGLKMDVTRIRKKVGPGDPELSAQLEALSGSIDDVVRSVRRIATELRPALLDDFGLGAAIEWQMREFEQRSGIRAQLDLGISNLQLAPDVSTALFRVFQEALTNVARHAQATQVDVSLHEQAGNLVLQVRDNGRGIRTGELRHTRSFGLASMRERVQLLSGELTLDGRPGQGTLISVKVPLSSYPQPG